MAITPEKMAAFQKELDELLEKHGLKLVVCPVFIDKLGHKHPITVGDVSAELQVNEKEKENAD